MAEVSAVCPHCGERFILGDTEKIGVELDPEGAPGIEVPASIVPEIMAGLREWLEAQRCPACGGGPLRVDTTDEA